MGTANPAQVTPQDTAESHSFSVTSAQNEEGISNEGAGVSFSDTDFEALQTVSPNRRHNSDVTSHAFRVPTRPSTTQRQRGTSSNQRRNSVTPVTHTVPPVTPSPHAGISTRGHACTMTRAMAESVDQRNFFGTSKMHNMAHSATTELDDNGQTVEYRQQ